MNLTADVEWIAPCSDVPGGHMHVAVHLLRTAEGYVLVDTGSVVHRDHIRTRLERATDGQGPDAVLLTHTDYPHTGNLSWMLAEWPATDIYVGTSNPEGQDLPARARQSSAGEPQAVAGREFDFVDPPLADRSMTNWIYDTESGVLFTSDGLGYHHSPDSCGATSRDLGADLSARRVREYHRMSLPWLRYVDPPLLLDELEAVRDRYDPSWLAPSHGPPIERRDIDRYMDEFGTALDRIAGEYEP